MWICFTKKDAKLLIVKGNLIKIKGNFKFKFSQKLSI